MANDASSEAQDLPAKKCAAGAPAWVLTFADLMSLLLAFFVLLFSFSEIDNLKYKQIAGSMRDAFGVQREVKVKEPPKGINIVAREFSPGRTRTTPLNEVRQSTTNEALRYPVLEKRPPERDAAVAQEGERIRKAMAVEIEQGSIDVDVQHRKIVIRIREKGSFPSGSAELLEPFRPVIQRMSEALRETKGEIAVAGYTDNIPIATLRFRSNWDLSASRAVTVLHELIDASGLPPARFQVQGYADTKPLAPNDTVEGRASNRRVEVTLVFNDSPAAAAGAGPEPQPLR
jgi:chemotaxis protein MotB